MGGHEPVFDYIVVGAGSAGCVLAARLSEDPSVRVALLEAGGSDRSWRIQMPAALAYPLAGGRYVWRFETEPEPHLGGRRIAQPRGRVLGGTSSINGMMWVRGHGLDFDRWAAKGSTGWSYAEVLPYFRRIEACAAGADRYRGSEGPLCVSRGRSDATPLTSAFLAACREAGYPLTEDINGQKQEGSGLIDRSIRRGMRESTADAYLRPASGRRNLAVLTKSHVLRVSVDGRRATGVICRRGDGQQMIRAQREVILAAGAIGSPHLLLLSGIGPAEALRRHGIDVIADRPGVGANLHDHPDIVLRHLCPEPVSLHRTTGPGGRLLAGARWFLSRTGPAAANHFDAGAFIRSEPGVSHPDLQLSFLPLALAPGAVQSDRSIGAEGFQVHIDLLRPLSRGRLELRSADPAEPPSLLFNYLANPADRRRLAKGLRLGREILSKPAMARFRGAEVTPGSRIASDEAVDAWLAGHADTAYHPVGTCRMGDRSKPMIVADPACRVIGVEGLRVVDASLMPAIVSGNTNAATIMIAERASDLIRGLTPLAADPAPVFVHPNWREAQR